MTSNDWKSSQTSEKDAHSGEPGNDPSRFDGSEKLAKVWTRLFAVAFESMTPPVGLPSAGPKFGRSIAVSRWEPLFSVVRRSSP